MSSNQNSNSLNHSIATVSPNFADALWPQPADFKPPLVSIIMPVYNRDRYLEVAISSVLSQTYRDFELLIWDDGSTDRSLDIANHYAQQDARVRVIAAAHQGAAHALKGAYAAAQGIYLGQVDSDDALDFRALELTVPVLNSHPEVGMVYTDHWQINAGGQVQGLGHRCQIPYSPDRLLIDFMTFHFRLLRRSVYEQVGGFREAFESIEDYDLCLRLSEVTEIWHFNQPLYYYRLHPTSVSSTRTIEQVLKSQLAINEAIVRRGLSDRYQLRLEVQARFFIDQKPTDAGAVPATSQRLQQSDSIPDEESDRASYASYSHAA
ncbi:MAG: glycosyltransferase [Nostoc sp. ChiQUE01a]|nr:glycosyltransferase [Nostoc sp. ChiQUE01a]